MGASPSWPWTAASWRVPRGGRESPPRAGESVPGRRASAPLSLLVRTLILPTSSNPRGLQKERRAFKERKPVLLRRLRTLDRGDSPFSGRFSQSAAAFRLRLGAVAPGNHIGRSGRAGGRAASGYGRQGRGHCPGDRGTVTAVRRYLPAGKGKDRGLSLNEHSDSGRRRGRALCPALPRFVLAASFWRAHGVAESRACETMWPAERSKRGC